MLNKEATSEHQTLPFRRLRHRVCHQRAPYAFYSTANTEDHAIYHG